MTAPTEVLYFSLNQGQCWYTVRLEEAIDVQNIRCCDSAMCWPSRRFVGVALFVCA